MSESSPATQRQGLDGDDPVFMVDVLDLSCTEPFGCNSLLRNIPAEFSRMLDEMEKGRDAQRFVEIAAQVRVTTAAKLTPVLTSDLGCKHTLIPEMTTATSEMSIGTGDRARTGGTKSLDNVLNEVQEVVPHELHWGGRSSLCPLLQAAAREEDHNQESVFLPLCLWIGSGRRERDVNVRAESTTSASLETPPSPNLSHFSERNVHEDLSLESRVQRNAVLPSRWWQGCVW